MTPAARPLEGQLSLLPDVPPVKYCRRCRRLLRGERSLRQGVGPRCARAERTLRRESHDSANRDDEGQGR